MQGTQVPLMKANSEQSAHAAELLKLAQGVQLPEKKAKEGQLLHCREVSA